MPPLLNPEKSFVIGFSDKARTEALPQAEIPTGYYKLPQTFVAIGRADRLAEILRRSRRRRLPGDCHRQAGKANSSSKELGTMSPESTLIIDITARDINKREGLTTNNLLGKNFPSSTCVGPAVLLQRRHAKNSKK